MRGHGAGASAARESRRVREHGAYGTRTRALARRVLRIHGAGWHVGGAYCAYAGAGWHVGGAYCAYAGAGWHVGGRARVGTGGHGAYAGRGRRCVREHGAYAGVGVWHMGGGGGGGAGAGTPQGQARARGRAYGAYAGAGAYVGAGHAGARTHAGTSTRRNSPRRTADMSARHPPVHVHAGASIPSAPVHAGASIHRHRRMRASAARPPSHGSTGWAAQAQARGGEARGQGARWRSGARWSSVHVGTARGVHIGTARRACWDSCTPSACAPARAAHLPLRTRTTRKCAWAGAHARGQGVHARGGQRTARARTRRTGLRTRRTAHGQPRARRTARARAHAHAHGGQGAHADSARTHAMDSAPVPTCAVDVRRSGRRSDGHAHACGGGRAWRTASPRAQRRMRPRARRTARRRARIRARRGAWRTTGDGPTGQRAHARGDVPTYGTPTRVADGAADRARLGRARARRTGRGQGEDRARTRTARGRRVTWPHAAIHVTYLVYFLY
ncbi:hypothetical protein GGX14DRAFT_393003 [Mycena pura]|uniref:Uncharacterized protein n=1 Tax=Mycena pura TaxID=153505 RepID=A0AAD6VI50_9AGAR|nr:hypothetical protein GGX14DRAFT_393003 [Mycena pura]